MVTFVRIIKYGLQDFYRNISLSVSTIGILAMMLFVLMSAVMVRSVSSLVVTSVRDKIDIALYFKKDTSEDLITQVQKELQSMDLIASASYIPPDKTLENFKERNKGNAAIIQAVEEIGGNPFQASIAIKAKDPAMYHQVADYIDSAFFKEAIDRLTFNENKLVIDKLQKVNTVVDTGAIAVVFLLGMMAVLVVFNTIRLAIYSQREEISIMKLVGASNFFVRAPFVVTGLVYGVIAAFISLFIFWPLTSAASPYLASFVSQMNISELFSQNFGKIVLVDFGGGLLLGAISSYIAVRKYLIV